VRAGLTSAASFLQREVGHRLRVRHTPALEFEIDRAFDQAFKVDALLREVAAEAGGGASAEASGGGGGEDGDEDEDEDEDGEKRDSGDR
jgi:hypothetical protein